MRCKSRLLAPDSSAWQHKQLKIYTEGASPEEGVVTSGPGYSCELPPEKNESSGEPQAYCSGALHCRIPCSRKERIQNNDKIAGGKRNAND